MRAATTTPGASFQVEDLADPSPGAGDLLVRVSHCGICGSDLKSRPMMAHGTVMGHELCGEVVGIGAEVANDWREGDRVAVLPVASCGACDRCRAGMVGHCASAALVGLGGGAGGFAELIRVSAAISYRLPESIPEPAGALVEPFAVGLHTARIAAIQAGDRVLVIGGGPVGLTTAAWARELGAGDITVSDPAPARRAAAATFGATAAVDPTVDELGGPFDVIFECVGKPGLLDVAAGVADVNGRIVVAGVCVEPDPFMPIVALLKELRIGFSVYYTPDEFQTVVDAFATGRIDPSPIVTRTVGLGMLDDVFESLASSPTDLKVLVDPSA